VTLIERLRALVEAVPPGGAVTIPRDWLAGELGAGADGAPTGGADTVLTVAQLAERLHRSPSTVRGWCEQSRFSGAFKLNGKDWRVPITALAAFLDGQRPETSREDAPHATISTRADTRVPRRRARKSDAADLGAWRRARADEGE
jgi:hypothetical protein